MFQIEIGHFARQRWKQIVTEIFLVKIEMGVEIMRNVSLIETLKKKIGEHVRMTNQITGEKNIRGELFEEVKKTMFEEIERQFAVAFRVVIIPKNRSETNLFVGH